MSPMNCSQAPPRKRREKYPGGLCLIDAIEAGGSADLIATLLAAFPDSVRQKDHRGRLPLAIALQAGSDFGVVDALLADYPEAASVAHLRKLPMHLAVEFGACPRTVRALAEDHPDGVRNRYYQMLPLHLLLEANGSDTDIGVVETLLDAWPDSSNVYYLGKPPLLLALEVKAPPLVVKLLYDRNPEISTKPELKR